MKQKTLLLAVMTLFFTAFLFAQNAKQTKSPKQITGYAITASEKGQTGWKEVRLVDITTGEELKTIYKDKQEVEILNARTGKPVVKKEITLNSAPMKRVVNLDQELDRQELAAKMKVYVTDENQKSQPTKVEIPTGTVEKMKRDIATTINSNVNNNIVYVFNGVAANYKVSTDKPFATNSAAMAYDKKHDRLYYTPMSINQLRYIDLKSNKIYYFEDEPFGKVSGMGDAPNQITRMVIASDGNGYALTNDGNHLIRFTTGKKPEITDLGSLTDDAANGKFSVHSRGGYGGDMIADASNNLYLIMANHNVFKISIDSRTAAYQGTIKGLPQGFTTNGAMVEDGSKIIVCSSESTAGYFRFDLANIQAAAEKVSASGNVYNASDLANGNLAFEKKKKNKKEPEEVKEETTQPVTTETEPASKVSPQTDALGNNSIIVYPNPVTDGVVKLSFTNQPVGKYQLQLLDMSGKLIRSQEVNISNKIQIEEFRFPELVSKGNYMIKVSSEPNKVSVVNKIVVQ